MHRVFHRIGVVLAVVLLLIAGFCVAAAIGNAINGAATTMWVGWSWIAAIWAVVAAVAYIFVRAIGWIIAGAMAD